MLVPLMMIPGRVNTRCGCRRLSARDFFRDLSMMDSGPKDSWELVMGSGDRELVDALDVVLMGHTDG